MRTQLRIAATLAALVPFASAQFPVHERVGDDPSDFLGTSVAGVGDVNGDGYEDFVVGVPGDDDFTGSAGSASVYSGLDGGVIYRIDGTRANEQLGTSVAGGRDVDGDGVPDFAIGASWYDAAGPIQGRVEVRSGATGALIWNLEGVNTFALFGETCELIGDLNGDGRADILVGAPNDDDIAADSGVVYAFSGLDASLLYQVSGLAASDQLGFSLAVVGDADGDGVDDWVAGAPFADVPGTSAGQAFLVSGATGAVLFAPTGAGADHGFGRCVAGAGDVNGDGAADFAVGAWRDGTGGTDAGSVVILSGLDASLLRRHDGAPGDRFGFGLAGVGDYDGDGFDDLAAGARFESGAGTVRVLSGLDGSQLAFLQASGAPLGEVLGGGFDVNADGLDEFLTGERNFSNSRGRATVYSRVNLLGTPYCFGDGSGNPCPCGNQAGPGEGCANGSGAGATLGASGSASVSADNLVFLGAGMRPNQPALLFAGLNATGGGNGLIFGDGLRCAGGSVVRLGVRTPDPAGAASWGPGLAAQEGFVAGDLRRFQIWYRDPAGTPCGAGFNLSNGFAVSFLP